MVKIKFHKAASGPHCFAPHLTLCAIMRPFVMSLAMPHDLNPSMLQFLHGYLAVLEWPGQYHSAIIEGECHKNLELFWLKLKWLCSYTKCSWKSTKYNNCKKEKRRCWLRFSVSFFSKMKHIPMKTNAGVTLSKPKQVRGWKFGSFWAIFFKPKSSLMPIFHPAH